MLIHTQLRGPVGYCVTLDREGREHLVAVGKQTFAFPEREGETLRLLGVAEQAPLVEVDRFRADPATSAPLVENDFAASKARCDVIMHGCAHAPGGRPTRSCEVEVRVGAWRKALRVLGDRVWTSTLGDARLSTPVAFERIELGYERAFGGTRDDPQRPGETLSLRENPVGVGYQPFAFGPVEGLAGPNLEYPDDPITSPRTRHRPAAFGPIGRSWLPRIRLAGTYDQHWLDHVFPFLPPDFDPAYFQAAPLDQQIELPRGGEICVLINLTTTGLTSFRLPDLAMPVEFTRSEGRRYETHASMDTLVIDAEAGRASLTWRASLPLERSVREVCELVFGSPSPAHARARASGKTYHRSLAALARANAARL